MAKKPGYSFSALELYDSCPLAYKLVRLDRIPRGESEPLKIGGDCHQKVGDYLSRLVDTGQTTDWEWAGGLLTPSDHPDVVEIFQRFIENFVLPPGMEAPGIEKKLAFTRAWAPTEFFAPDAYFRAVVDFTFRQGGLVVVQDWKTNRMISEIEKNLQTRIYGWAVRQTLYPDAQDILLRLHFLRYGSEREILLTPGDLDTVPQELEAKIAAIEAEKHFDPTPGSFCGWCGVTAHCPIMAQALIPANVLYPVNHEDAVKAATLLLAIQTMDKALKEHLKKYVQEYGPVQVGDQIYGPSLSTTYDLDPREITEHLLGEGLEVDQVWNLLNLTKTSLERGLKRLKRKDLLDAILAAAPSKETEKFGFSKRKEA
jgi:hypothetical protein